jgi:hypothetical protein
MGFEVWYVYQLWILSAYYQFQLLTSLAVVQITEIDCYLLLPVLLVGNRGQMYPLLMTESLMASLVFRRAFKLRSRNATHEITRYRFGFAGAGVNVRGCPLYQPRSYKVNWGGGG